MGADVEIPRKTPEEPLNRRPQTSPELLFPASVIPTRRIRTTRQHSYPDCFDRLIEVQEQGPHKNVTFTVWHLKSNGDMKHGGTFTRGSKHEGEAHLVAMIAAGRL